MLEDKERYLEIKNDIVCDSRTPFADNTMTYIHLTQRSYGKEVYRVDANPNGFSAEDIALFVGQGMIPFGYSSSMTDDGIGTVTVYTD